MTDPKEKPKIKGRTPKKVTPGTFDNLRKPHPVEEFLGLVAEPTHPTPPTPRTPPTPHTTPVAPERDFTKTANSIVRDVVAGGLFIGKSKQLYDYLYSKTRGAIAPTRSVCISKPKLMRGSGIGSERTLLKNLNHLKTIGLITIDVTDGKHEGNKYTVFLPEERTPRTPPTPPTVATAHHPPEKVGSVPPAESGVRGVGVNQANTTVSESSKTSLKTTTDDDDYYAFQKMFVTLSNASFDVTKKFPKSADQQAWAEVAEILASELKEAAAKARSVSSAPAFLAEHLRRRLSKPLRKSREEKRAPVVEIPSQLERDPDRRLTPEEITSYAATVTDLLKDGATLEDVTAQFAGSLHPEDWTAIRSAALAHKGKE